ncbi:MAG: ATP-binding protein [Candidatus Methylomirabilales bacterium]
MKRDVSPQGGQDFEAVFGPVLEQIMGLLEAEAGIVWVWEETPAAFIPALCRGRASWATPWIPSRPEGIGYGELDPSRKTLLFDDLPLDCPVPTGEQKIRSFASVPLTVGGRGTGFLALYSRRRGHFAPRDLRFLQMVGQLMGVTIMHLFSRGRAQARLMPETTGEEEEFRQGQDFTMTLIDAMGEGVMVLDAQGRWEFGNRQMYEMLGYEPREFSGRSGGPGLQPLGFSTADLARFRRRDRACIFETRMFRKDGSSFPALVSIAPRRGPRGKFLGTIVLVTDITERRQWDQQLMRSEKLAALGTLAAGVAHNINNVLAAIVARTDLLLRQVQDPELKRWLNSIQQSALDGASTVRRLQDFARTGTPESMVPVDVNRVITEVLQLTQARWKDEAELRGTRIEVVTDLGEVPLIAANPAELREVFTNMVFNALDAMPHGGRLSVRTRLDPGREEGRWVEVVFVDTGVGMSEEVRQKIFDPFFTTKGVKGTGLGLSTSYGIVARHGGSISVESEIGRGGIFTIVFPVPAKLPRSLEGFFTPARRRIGRILVIDDEPHLREVVTNLLKLEGHIAMGVASGIEGVEAFRAEPYDVVITDLGMPELTGLEVARKVRQLWPEVKVILCTGWNVTVGGAEQEEWGVDRLIEKPFRLDKILRLVHDLLQEVSQPELR